MNSLMDSLFSKPSTGNRGKLFVRIILGEHNLLNEVVDKLNNGLQLYKQYRFVGLMETALEQISMFLSW